MVVSVRLLRAFHTSSRSRLLQAIASIPWSAVGRKWFVTLSYPDVFPTDGKVCKEHLKAFRKRFERRYGRPMVLVWKMEFQKRGAVHFHLLMPAPSGLFLDGSGNKESLEQFREWVARSWGAVVAPWVLANGGTGEDMEKHYRSHRHERTVMVSTSDCSKYFAYALREKQGQNRVPEGFDNPGRFWGIWGYKPEWSGALLTRAEYVELRRTLVKWQRSKAYVADELGHLTRSANAYTPKARGRLTSTWYLTDTNRGFLVVADLVRAVPGRDLLPLLT